MSGQWNAGAYGGTGGYQQGGYGAQQGSQQVVTCSHLTLVFRDCKASACLDSAYPYYLMDPLPYYGSYVFTRRAIQKCACADAL